MDVYITSAICMQMGRLEFQGMGEVDFLQSMIIMATKLIKKTSASYSTPSLKHHHHVQHHLYQVASPKSLDAGADINAILQFSDSDEAIYDCFINPKYKVLTKTF